MKKFGWNRWYKIYKNNNWRSLERWALYNLHHPFTLRDLAFNIAVNNYRNGVNTSVEVESIWIDGTPQAQAFVNSGTVKCELADLLFIVEEYDSNDVIVNEKGLLLQAKVTPKYNKLDANSSTKKERKLFETIDSSKVMELYSGTNLQSIKIGSYVLGGKNNFFDCARFLLMPKKLHWQKHLTYWYPFHVCWPKSMKTSFMGHSLGLVDAVQSMVLGGSIGKPIIDPNVCEWSRMVRDLQNKYNSVQMSGYNQQHRVQRSPLIKFSTNQVGIVQPSVESSHLELSDEAGIPFIPTVTVRIKNNNEERRG
ncbi:hypothetical protein HJ056_04460 [Vibrio parahaemolyticus]|nr:hypothetical protein [Vibrio parahaemolyticus]MBE4333274.1 hypothetical protein [Vibrio parahaemolyticus]MBE4355722.1 hypothetical protein [Vibrio parahaemolyticus]MBE5137793.1 hypothetical protein [Vibrio parahaemolyticus]TBT68750.1 hypothetical protein D5E73_03515 [Vibrio parahaemolyticus]